MSCQYGYQQGHVIMGHELWMSLGDSVDILSYPIQTGSQDFRVENTIINSSTLQSDILLHKHIHICGQYNF